MHRLPPPGPPHRIERGPEMPPWPLALAMLAALVILVAALLEMG